MKTKDIKPGTVYDVVEHGSTQTPTPRVYFQALVHSVTAEGVEVEIIGWHNRPQVSGGFYAGFLNRVEAGQRTTISIRQVVRRHDGPLAA